MKQIGIYSALILAFLILVYVAWDQFGSCEKENQKVLVFDSAELSIRVKPNDKMDSLLAIQTGLVLGACLKDPESRVIFSELLEQFSLARLKQLEGILNFHQGQEDKL